MRVVNLYKEINVYIKKKKKKKKKKETKLRIYIKTIRSHVGVAAVLLDVLCLGVELWSYAYGSSPVAPVCHWHGSLVYRIYQSVI